MSVSIGVNPALFTKVAHDTSVNDSSLAEFVIVNGSYCYDVEVAENSVLCVGDYLRYKPASSCDTCRPIGDNVDGAITPVVRSSVQTASLTPTLTATQGGQPASPVNTPATEVDETATGGDKTVAESGQPEQQGNLPTPQSNLPAPQGNQTVIEGEQPASKPNLPAPQNGQSAPKSRPPALKGRLPSSESPLDSGQSTMPDDRVRAEQKVQVLGTSAQAQSQASGDLVMHPNKPNQSSEPSKAHLINTNAQTSEILPPVGPQLTVAYNTKFDAPTSLPREELRKRSQKQTTYTESQLTRANNKHQAINLALGPTYTNNFANPYGFMIKVGNMLCEGYELNLNITIGANTEGQTYVFLIYRRSSESNHAPWQVKLFSFTDNELGSQDIIAKVYSVSKKGVTLTTDYKDIHCFPVKEPVYLKGFILKDNDTFEKSQDQNPNTNSTNTAKPLPNNSTNTAEPLPTSADLLAKPKPLPRRSHIVNGNQQYPLVNNLISHPHMDHYFVKERTETKPSHYLVKLVLRHQYLNRDDINDETHTATQAQQAQTAAIVAEGEDKEGKDGAVTERKHFPMNLNMPGFVVFSSDLTRFVGNIKYPLPSRKATAVKLGKGGNGFVFAIFHNGKEYAVKKTVYRPNEIRVHSQLAHPNLINLDAVLIGEEHENHKGKYYAFCFMTKCDMDFRSVISTKEHGCLKHLKLQLSDQHDAWQLVMVNVKYVLRSVLKALDYMHKQGLVHRDVKASNILLKMQCQCTKPLMCACPQKYLIKLGDFDSSTTVPGHGLKIEPHQMIRYASVLPLGTMGYRAPEVAMHLVIAGPYEVLYTTAVDIWSFGCLLLNILIGKCGPLKQRGEASLLLSVQNQPYSENLYRQIIKIKELQKYYGNMPEFVDLVRKCLQVEVHCRPTAKQLLQLDVLQGM